MFVWGGLASLVAIAWPSTAAAVVGDGSHKIAFRFADSGPQAPAGVKDHIVNHTSASAVMLSNVPTSSWTYGCSATSAGMIFGYYDRIGYSNMYAGPTNGGVAPLTDLGNTISLIATQQGFDGRTTRGHVDDYWTGLNATGDPYKTNGWTEHTWGGCVADYMGTNQWKWDYYNSGSVDSNADGATTVFYNEDNSKLYNYIPPSSYGTPQTEVCHGMRLFAESRGYTVAENYTQCIDTLYAGGFSFADYEREINNGCPVMIQVDGHTMVGVGYNASDSTVYLHDTWGDYTASMTWGGSYDNMAQYAVTVIHLAAVPEPSVFALLGTGLAALLGLACRRPK